MTELFIAIAAFITSFAGLVFLLLSWQNKTDRAQNQVVAFAWFIIAISIYLWTIAYGSEFGVCYGFISIALQAWILVLYQHKTNGKPNKTRAFKAMVKTQVNWTAGLKSLPKVSLILLAVIPLSGFASMQVLAGLTALLPGEKVNSMALGVYLLPVLWGIFAYWVCAAQNLARPVISLVTISVISYSVNYLL